MYGCVHPDICRESSAFPIPADRDDDAGSDRAYNINLVLRSIAL